MTIGSLSSISIGSDDRLAMVEEAAAAAVAVAEANAEAEEATVDVSREGECEVIGALVSPEEQISMRASFAGGGERPRLLALERAQEVEDAEGLAEDAKKEDDACGVASSRFPRFSRRKRSMARSRGSVKSSGASGGRGGRSQAKKEAVG